MWKPWILVAIGSIVAVNVAGRGLAPQNAIDSYEATHSVVKSQSFNSMCWSEIEKVCGAQPTVQQLNKVVIEKKGTYRGTGDEKADLVNALKSAIGQLNTPLPGNFNSLCTNVVSSVSQDIQSTTIDGVDGVLAAWNLPSQVSSFLANIKFSEDVVYQTYRFALQNGNSELQEFIASGKNNGEKIIMAYMKVHVQGTAIQQYVVTRVCKKHLLVLKKCHDEYNPRGFNTDEVMSIQNGLIYHGYNKLMAEVDQLNAMVKAIPHIKAKPISKIHVHATDSEKLNWLEKAIIESYKQMKAQFDVDTKSEVVKKITDLTFNSFVADAEIKYIKNMDSKYFTAFSANLVNGLEVADEETRKKIQEYMDMVPFTEIGQWNMMRTMYNADQVSNANYICLMTFRDENEKYSIYTVQMKNSFEIAPDILILRDSKSSFGGLFSMTSERVERIPHAMTPVDLQQMLDYFDLVAFDRFMKLFNMSKVESALEDLSSYKVEKHQVQQGLEGFKSLLGVVDQTFNTIKNIFSSSSKTAIVERITKLGFTELQSTCLIQMYKGVPAEKFDTLKRVIMKSSEVPANLNDAFNDWWELAEFTDGSTWQLQNTAYTKDSQGNAKYMTIMYNRDDATGKYTFFVADVKGSFNVAEDMYIWQKQKSSFGGLFQKDQQEIKYLPHTITIDEAELLMNFFDMIALSKYDMYLRAFINSTQTVESNDSFLY